MHRDTTPPRALFRIDPGWLYLIAGLAILASVMVMPALDDLANARWEREKARARVAWQSERIGQHASFLERLQSGDEAVLRNLLATQLNLTPVESEPLIGFQVGLHGEAGILDELEPPMVIPEQSKRPDSTLRFLATDSRARLITLGVGSMCVALGLVIGTNTRRDPEAPTLAVS